VLMFHASSSRKIVQIGFFRLNPKFRYTQPYQVDWSDQDLVRGGGRGEINWNRRKPQRIKIFRFDFFIHNRPHLFTHSDQIHSFVIRCSDVWRSRLCFSFEFCPLSFVNGSPFSFFFSKLSPQISSGLVTNLLNQYLGDFIQGLDKNQLQLSVFSGFFFSSSVLFVPIFFLKLARSFRRSESSEPQSQTIGSQFSSTSNYGCLCFCWSSSCNDFLSLSQTPF
jgi:hypothetical protein